MLRRLRVQVGILRRPAPSLRSLILSSQAANSIIFIRLKRCRRDRFECDWSQSRKFCRPQHPLAASPGINPVYVLHRLNFSKYF
jgi:hypothetical protein